MIERLRRLWALAIPALTGTLLAAALGMEHLLGLEPCPLCLMQRIWMIVAGLVCLAALLHRGGQRFYAGLGAFAGVVGGGFSIRHLYLQSLPEDQAPSCGPDLGYMFENVPLRDVLAAMTHGTGDCAKVESLIDVLIPVGALAGFIAIVLICTLAILRR
ncbi:MAG: disulfide bond formation protein B [Pseudomonadales bacterium]